MRDRIITVICAAETDAALGAWDSKAAFGALALGSGQLNGVWGRLRRSGQEPPAQKMELELPSAKDEDMEKLAGVFFLALETAPEKTWIETQWFLRDEDDGLLELIALLLLREGAKPKESASQALERLAVSSANLGINRAQISAPEGAKVNGKGLWRFWEMKMRRALGWRNFTAGEVAAPKKKEAPKEE